MTKSEKTKTQWYLGAPNAVVLCVDGGDSLGFSGRFYHSYQEEAIPFEEQTAMLFALEAFYDDLRFPFPSTTMRTFGEPKNLPFRQPKERTKIMSDKELLEKHGDLGTFIIRVQQRQNSTWQGRITWMDEDKTVNFRSIWEMIHLIEEAVGPEEDEKQNW